MKWNSSVSVEWNNSVLVFGLDKLLERNGSILCWVMESHNGMEGHILLSKPIVLGLNLIISSKLKLTGEIKERARHAQSIIVGDRGKIRTHGSTSPRLAPAAVPLPGTLRHCLAWHPPPRLAPAAAPGTLHHPRTCICLLAAGVRRDEGDERVGGWCVFCFFDSNMTIWWNGPVLDIWDIFSFGERVDSISLTNQMLKLALGAKWFHYISPCSKTIPCL
jgi:hypothetical protein